MKHEHEPGHSFGNAETWAKEFDNPARDVWQKPDEILDALMLPPTARVADIGSGTGYFSVRIANRVPDGKVFAVDIAANFLKHIDKTCQEAGIKNVETVLCDQFSTKLPKNSVDLVFICDTYHHFEFPDRTLSSIHDALRPGGQIVLIDFERIEGKSSAFVLYHVRAGKEVFVAEIKAAGFKVLGEEKLLKENYLVRFEKVVDKNNAKPK